MADPFGAPLPSQYAFQGQGGAYGGGWFNNPQSVGPSYGAPYGQPAYDDLDELPLLEELGVDLPAIWRKGKAVLLGRVGADSLKDIDMGGPLLFATCLASLHLLSGKLHFGVILGWSAVSSTLFWFVINQLAGDAVHPGNKESIDLYNCCACLGYCLLPLLLTNCVAILLPHSTLVTWSFIGVSLWCAYLAARLVTKRAAFLQEQLYTVAYPAFLYYVTVSLISMY